MFQSLLDQAEDEHSYSKYVEKLKQVLSQEPLSLSILDAASQGILAGEWAKHLELNHLLKGILQVQDLQMLCRLTGQNLTQLKQNALLSEASLVKLLERAEKVFQADLTIVLLAHQGPFKKFIKNEKKGIFLAFKYKKAVDYKIKFVPVAILAEEQVLLTFFMSFWEFIQKEKSLYQEREI